MKNSKRDSSENKNNKNLFDGYTNTVEMAKIDTNVDKFYQSTRYKYYQHFSDLSVVKGISLNEIAYETLKQLYMTQPQNQECLLYLLQNRNDEDFNSRSYTKNMIKLFNHCYRLPNILKRKINVKKIDFENGKLEASCYPFDELFIWSLTLYGGKEEELELIKYYWSLTKHPIACALIAVIIYKRFQNFNFVSDELKQKLLNVNEEFESLATKTLFACYENAKMIDKGKEHLIAQDLLLYELEMFYNKTVLDIAINAEVHSFIGLTPVQQRLTDIWYERINPDVSSWKIFMCLLFVPFTILPIRLFRNNNDNDSRLTSFIKKKITVADLESENHKSTNSTVSETTKSFIYIPNRKLRSRLKNTNSIMRIIWFLNAPLIKYINHLIVYILFLICYCGFILFDYYPLSGMYPSNMNETYVDSKLGVLKITITEVIVIYWIILFQIDFLLQCMRIPNKNIFRKIRIFFEEDSWNIYDLFVFITNYAAVIIRFYPSTSTGCIFSSESCFESARVLYCINLILWFARFAKFLIILEFWGPKIFIISRMVKELSVFFVLLLMFFVPFGSAYESILNKTQPISFQVILDSLNKLYWPIFGELGGLLDDIQNYDYGCSSSSACKNNLATFFMYLGLAFYVVICNLLLLNMIIAIFSSAVDETLSRSLEVYRFQRYMSIKDYYHKSMLPPPLVIFEYAYNIFVALIRCCKPDFLVTLNSFSIGSLDKDTESEYIYYQKIYQMSCLNEKSSHETIDNDASLSKDAVSICKQLSIDVNKRFKVIEQKLEQKDRKLNEIKADLEKIFNLLKR